MCLTLLDLIGKGQVERGVDIGSDHFPIIAKFGVIPGRETTGREKRWITKHVKWELFQVKRNKQQIGPTDIETCNKETTTAIIQAAEECIPETSGKRIYRRKCPWWDKECAEAVARRKRAKSALFKEPTETNLINYKRLEAKAKNIIRKKKRESWQKYIEEIDSETPIRNVYRRIRAMNGLATSYELPLKDLECSIQERADMLVEHFCRHKNQGGGHVDEVVQEYLGTEMPAGVCISKREIKEVVKKLKNTSPGQDRILNIMLKNLSEDNIEMLVELFNISWASASIPIDWKEGIICPIPKPGKNLSQVNSYRPITLLSCLGKVLEKIIKNRLGYEMEKKELYHYSQLGFRKGKGTRDALVRLKQYISDAAEQNRVCIVVYLDIESAYDRVWHEGLLYKMIELGFDRQTIGWIADFLQDRVSRVRIGDIYSAAKKIEIGVPQGSALSPSIFNIMLHDLPKEENVKIIPYADDLTLVVADKCIKQARTQMQGYIKKISNWAAAWRFTINPKVSTYQVFTGKRIIPTISLKLNNQELTEVKEKKYLGIILDAPKLNFNSYVAYIKNICEKRVCALKVIASNRWGACRKQLRTIYINYIRSKLEYGSVIYGKLSGKNVRTLEVIQNNCLRTILGARKTSPITSMEVEAFIPPIEIRYKYMLIKYYVNLLYRSRKDTTAEELKVVSLNKQNLNGGFMKEVAGICRELNIESLVRVYTNVVGPFSLMESMEFVNVDEVDVAYDVANSGNGKRVEIKIQTQYPNHCPVYTDGSKQEHSVAAGVYIPKIGKAINWKMNPAHSALGAEIFAIEQAIKLIEELQMSERSVILSDSRTALQMIANRDSKSYAHGIQRVQTLIHQSGNQIKLQWVRGHQGLKGNEIADAIARKGHENLRSALTRLDKEEQWCEIQSEIINFWKVAWKDKVNLLNKGRFYSDIVEDIKRKPWLNLKSRQMECALTRLRLGHAGVTAHLHRFNMKDTDQCETCGTRETIEHFIMHCDKYGVARGRMREELKNIGVPLNLKNLFSGGAFPANKQKKIVKILSRYIQTTGRVSEL